MKAKRGFRAGEAASQFGRTASWLRQLEAQGVIPPASRDPLNGARLYTMEDIQEIRRILSARRRTPEPAAAGQVA